MKSNDAKHREASRHVNEFLRPKLDALGFRQRNDSFVLEQSGSILGIFGYGVTNFEPIGIYPSVGVCYEEIEREIAQLQERPYDFGACTISSPLRYLGPSDAVGPINFQFDGAAAGEKTAAKLIDVLVRFGIPFVREWSDLAKLIGYMKDLWARQVPGLVTDPSTTLPVALALIDRRDEGLQIVRQTVASLESHRNKGYIFAYRRFASAYERAAHAADEV